jgi:CII-binding regulator of phage lambda lysogenization HflD
MAQKSLVLEPLKPFIGPVVAVLIAATGAWGLTQTRIITLDTRVKTIEEQGSPAFQREKDKYYEQFLQIQKQLSSMDQRQQDMKEDLTEIKKHLNNR